jgi:integrase/recombinase XerD
MSDLSGQAGDYLRLRRALGRKLDDAHRLLPRFVAYLDAMGAKTVTVEAALAWACRPDADPASSVWMRRMTVARGFACHMAGVDPGTEVPPPGLVTFRQRRRQLFIYSDADIAALMSHARQSIPAPLRAATVETLIGLLAATGMFSGGHPVRRRSVPRVCAAQRLMEERYRSRQVWCKDDARRVIGVVSRC